jgi:glycosyltransferase involved in cell wall biosynthesis
MPSTVAPDGDDEGGPALTVVCAQAAGVPVVVTPFPGAERSVIDRHSGLLCEYDPAGLRDRFIELIEDPELSATIGRGGANVVREEFSLETQVAALERIYQCAVENAAKSGLEGVQTVGR